MISTLTPLPRPHSPLPQSAVSTTVRNLTSKQRDLLAVTLAKAFLQDPMLRYFLPPCTSDRFHKVAAYLSFKIRISRDVVYCAEGASLWNPPKWKMGLPDILSILPQLVGTLSPLHYGSILRILDICSAHKPLRLHSYLVAIGVDPIHQGRGIGGDLMAPILKRSDRLNIGTYLETCNADSLFFYERFGFEVRREIKLPGNLPVLWTLWREPRPLLQDGSEEPGQTHR